MSYQFLSRQRPALDLDRPVFGKIKYIMGNVGNGKNSYAVWLMRWANQRCQHNVKFPEQLSDSVLDSKDWGRVSCLLCSKYGMNTIREAKPFFASNFPVAIPSFLEGQFEHIPGPDQFLDLKRKRRHSMWFIDEPDTYGLESRRSQSDIAVDITEKMKKTRHYNADSVLLTQLPSMIDPRARRLSHNLIYATIPDNLSFRYVMRFRDLLLPIRISLEYARKCIFPYFSTSTEPLEDADQELEPLQETDEKQEQLISI